VNPVIGPVSYGGAHGREDQFQEPWSEKTGEMLDAEVRKMIAQAHERTREAKKEEIVKVAQLLLQKEVLTREDMVNLLGKRPFKGKSDEMDDWLGERGPKRDPFPLLGREVHQTSSKPPPPPPRPGYYP